MKLFSYVVKRDTGFAPNPFGGVCTLATCKPRIRRVARPGDWIVGTGSSTTVGKDKLIYAMLVSEILPSEVYGADGRFQAKVPATSGPSWKRCGDNIYFQDDQGNSQQRRSYHGPQHMERDLSGRNVLIGREFYYFGNAALELPERFHSIIKTGPGHRGIEDARMIDAFVRWLRGRFQSGRYGTPVDNRKLSASDFALERTNGRRRSSCAPLAAQRGR